MVHLQILFHTLSDILIFEAAVLDKKSVAKPATAIMNKKTKD